MRYSLHHGKPAHDDAASGRFAVSAPNIRVINASMTPPRAARKVLALAPVISELTPSPPDRASASASVARSDIAIVRCAAMTNGFNAIFTVTAPSRAAV